jgi:hypothetical protein
MVDDDDILDVLERHHDDLDRAARSLVSAANRAGGEDNITVVAFTIAADGGDTVEMAAVEPADEDTLSGIEVPPAVDTMVIPADQVESALVTPPQAQARESRPFAPGARVRLVLAMAGLLAVAAVLLVWGLTR